MYFIWLIAQGKKKKMQKPKPEQMFGHPDLLQFLHYERAPVRGSVKPHFLRGCCKRLAPGITIPPYTAVPVSVKALTSIWPVQEALHLERTFAITCLLQASFALLKTNAAITADFISHPIEISANYML